MDEYIQARWKAGTASTSILEPLPLNACGDASNRTTPSTVSSPTPEAGLRQPLSPQLPSFYWEVAYQKCCEAVGRKAIVDIIINDLVNWGKLRQASPSEYNRAEWIIIYDWCKKEASMPKDPKSLNRWSYNSAVFIARGDSAIAEMRAKKNVSA